MVAHVGVRLALALACVAAMAAAPASAQRNSDPSEGVMTLAALEPQALEAGRCGLFLWSRGERPDFVFVAYDQPAIARVKVDGRVRELARTRFSGEVISGHFEDQTFADDDVRLEVRVRSDPERSVRDGAIIRDGVIRIVENDGWQSVTPVGGMVACQR